MPRLRPSIRPSLPTLPAGAADRLALPSRRRTSTPIAPRCSRARAPRASRRMVTIGAGGPLDAQRRAPSRSPSAHPQIFADRRHPPARRERRSPTRSSAQLARARRRTRRSSRSARPGSTTTTTTRRAERSAPRSRASSQLARALGLPLVVHLRDADADAAARSCAPRTRRDVGGVIHCFTGDARERARVPRSRLPHLVQRHRHLQDRRRAPRGGAHRAAPIASWSRPTRRSSRPIPYRGRRNEPALVVQTAAHARRAPRRVARGGRRRTRGGTRKRLFRSAASAASCTGMSRTRLSAGAPSSLFSRGLPPVHAQLPRSTARTSVLRTRLGEDRLRRQLLAQAAVAAPDAAGDEHDALRQLGARVAARRA